MIEVARPRLLAALALLAAGCFDSSVTVEMLAPPAGRTAASLEEVLRLPEEEVDIGRAALLVSKGERTGLDVETYTRRIDDLAARLDRRLAHSAEAAEVVAAMNDLLLRGRGALHQGEGSFARFDVSRVLDGRTGNCLAMSVLYLAVGQRLGLPMEGVTAPGHYFVRFARGRRPINIELTRWGASLPDSFYRRWLGIAPQTVTNGVYLSGDGTMELIAVLLANRSAVRSARGDFARAEPDARKALDLRPGYPQAMVNLGRSLQGLTRHDEARKLYRAALEIDPNCADALNNLAPMLLDSSSPELYSPIEAVEMVERAVRLRHGRAAYRLSAAGVHAQLGRFDRAIGHMNHAVRLEPRNALYRARLAEYRRRLIAAPLEPDAVP